MKKSFKAMATMTILAIMASANVFADDAKPAPQKTEMQKGNRKNPPKMRMRKMPFCDGEHLVIGQVKSIDESKNRLTITNTDGKTVEVSYSPFTRIALEPTKEEMQAMREKRAEAKENASKEKPLPPPAHSISDIKTGNWVMISSFKMDTKYPSAQTIFVKQSK